MRRHLILEHGDLGAVISKRKPHSTVTVTHEILRSVDPVPDLRRGGEGGGGGGDS